MIGNNVITKLFFLLTALAIGISAGFATANTHTGLSFNSGNLMAYNNVTTGSRSRTAHQAKRSDRNVASQQPDKRVVF